MPSHNCLEFSSDASKSTVKLVLWRKAEALFLRYDCSIPLEEPFSHAETFHSPAKISKARSFSPCKSIPSMTHCLSTSRSNSPDQRTSEDERHSLSIPCLQINSK